MVLAQCWNLTSLFPESLGLSKDSFERGFELVLEFNGLILESLRYGAVSQKTFSRGFWIGPCFMLGFNGSNSEISPRYGIES